MYTLARDSDKDIVVLINDFNPEFGAAIKKLSKKLKRELHGVILLDEQVKEKGLNKPDTSGDLETIVCDFNDVSSLSNAINGIRKKLLLVSSSSERNQPYLKLVLPHVSYLYGPAESTLDWATHKDTMRKLLRSYDAAIAPKSRIVMRGSEHEIDQIVKDLTFPMIVKPNGLAASVLVTKVVSEDELRARLNEAFEVLEDIYKRDSGRGEPSIIVEEFIEGDMFSIDAYVNQDGRVWCLPCIKVTTAASIGLEGYYSYRNDTTHGLTQKEVAAAQAVAAKAVHALQLRSCPSHIELFRTSTGWKIIELGPRAGGYRQDMYMYGYGIDHAYNELLIKVGLKPEIITTPIAHCAIYNMYAETEGVIKSIEGFEEAQKIPSVKSMAIYKVPGDKAVFCGNGGKFISDGVLSAQTFEQLNKDMDLVRSTIKISVEG